MPDILSVQPAMGLGNAPRPDVKAPQPEVAKPADSGASNSSTDYSQAKSADATAKEVRQLAERQASGEKIIAGPPPSFEASLLEIEGDLEMMIKRMDAERAHNQAQNDRMTGASGAEAQADAAPEAAAAPEQDPAARMPAQEAADAPTLPEVEPADAGGPVAMADGTPAVEDNAA